jgi:parvulin-like peptidyl-prolyl isomerase
MRGLKVLTVLMACAAAGAFAGEQKQAPPALLQPPKVVMAKVGDHEITVSEFMTFISQDASRVRQALTPSGKAQLLKELIVRRLLYQAVRQEGLLPENKEAVSGAELRQALGELAKKHFPPPAVPTEGELRAYYDAHRDQFGIPELVRVSQIQFRVPSGAKPADWEAAKGRAEAALARLKAGEPFDKLAGRLTENPRARESQGDVGFLPLHADPWLEQAVVGIKVGEHTGVLESKVGFEILEVTDRRASLVPPYQEVQDAVKQRFVAQQQQAARQRYVRQLVKEFGVTIEMKELKDAMP